MSSQVTALENLYNLNALDEEGMLTKLGRKMAEFPLEPPMSKVRCLARVRAAPTFPRGLYGARALLTHPPTSLDASSSALCSPLRAHGLQAQAPPACRASEPSWPPAAHAHREFSARCAAAPCGPSACERWWLTRVGVLPLAAAGAHRQRGPGVQRRDPHHPGHALGAKHLPPVRPP